MRGLDEFISTKSQLKKSRMDFFSNLLVQHVGSEAPYMSGHKGNNNHDEFSDFDGLKCADLPTTPCPEIGTVLVTGGSGYIGGLLAPELLARGYQVRVMVRGGFRLNEDRWPGADVVVADALKKKHMNWALEGIHTAFYLIHSLLMGPEEFEAADIQAAINFREAAREEGVKRIIYLGGLGDRLASKSRHLRSRVKVGDALRAGSVPVTTMRAAVVIGSGSASYEIIRHLVTRMPFILLPHWCRNKCHPIGVRDLIKYLVGLLETPETGGETLEACGNDILTYEEMLRIFADVLDRKIVFVPFPFSNIKFYSYFVSLLTPVPAQITVGLMEGLQDDAVCKTDNIRKYIPFEPLSYREAVVRAFTREEQDNVRTRWSDAYPPAYELAIKLHELDTEPIFSTTRSHYTKKDAASVFNSVCRIGGKAGWFDSNWMWRVRGGIDRLLSGPGSLRGRKSSSRLEVNDVIDFWRVEDLQKNCRLLLRAEMRMPGKAWLEFNIGDEGARTKLSITAHFHTTRTLGGLYWYIFLPFHDFIFRDLLVQICATAKETKSELKTKSA